MSCLIVPCMHGGLPDLDIFDQLLDICPLMSIVSGVI